MLISGVGYSAGTTGVSLAVDGQTVAITVGKNFILGTVASELPARVDELRAALQTQASSLLQQPDACLGAAVKQPTHSTPQSAAATAATPATPELSEARQKIIDEWQKVRGAAFKGTDEEKKKWQRLLPGVDVTAQRSTDPNYTTCGALPQYLLGKVGGISDPGISSGGLIGVRDGIQLGDQKSSDEAWVKGFFGPWAWTDKTGQIFKGGAKKLGAWVEHDGKKRPLPGDVYILTGVINSTKITTEGAKPEFGIRHIGVLLNITPNADGTETWTTGDAGQGKGDDQKALQQDRIYDPQQRTVTGGADKGTVIGWVDIDLLVSASAKKEAEIAASQAKKP